MTTNIANIDHIRNNPPRILNESEVAIYLNVSVRSVRSYRMAGLIRSVKIQGRRIYRLVDVDAALEKLVS